MTQSTTAMSNDQRTKGYMRNKDIKKEAHKAGYQYKGFWTCEACDEEARMAAQSVGYTGDKLPAWVNSRCALKFHKKGSTIAACKCGWRKDITIKFTPKEKTHCKVRGCNAIVGEKDEGGVCFKCRKEIAGGGNPATYAIDCSYENKASGCSFYVQEGRAGCIRTKCNKYNGTLIQPPNTQGQGVGLVKICNRTSCTNPVPVGRKAVCYSCQAPAKEAASSDFAM